MDIHLLEDIGLTKAQALAYDALIKNGNSTAPQIAKETGESRSNAYKLLDKLCELGLASREDKNSKLTYHATSPTALEGLVQKRAAHIQLQQRKLNAALPDMLHFFSSHTEQAAIRFFTGKEGIRKIYMDQIHTAEPVYFIRSPHDKQFFDMQEIHQIRNLFPWSGIKRYGITQDEATPGTYDLHDRIPIKESDSLMLLNRTWINEDDYDEPVEWGAYGDKLSILSFGKEATGVIIESPHIAKAFRQLFKLLDKTIRAQDGYVNMPQKALYTKRPLSLAIKQHMKK